MFKPIIYLIYYQMLQTFREAFAWITPILFYLLGLSLFAVSIGLDEHLLVQSAPSIIWILTLLSVLLSINHLFLQDKQDGILEHYVLSQSSLTTIVACKLISHWLLFCLPLILISPIVVVFFHLSLYELGILMLVLLLGTPVLTLIGGIGASLTVGLKNSGLLLPLLILPLYVPVLIFGTSAMQAARMHEPLLSYFALLGALNLITFCFAPLLTSVALKMGVEQA